MTPPTDSILNDWLTAMSITEMPLSYAVLTGAAVIGASLGRTACVDHTRFQVWPNLSVLLVGPSGIGKDTAIDQAVEAVEGVGTVPVIGGRTMERFMATLADLGDPAAALVPAYELADFFGSRDYQSGMIQSFTNMLSNKVRVDAGTKGEGKVLVANVALSVLAGSTPAWIHDAMPAGALGGGFFPRFVVVVEFEASRYVPWPKYATPLLALLAAREARQRFVDAVGELAAAWQIRPGDMLPLPEAMAGYATWYRQRFSRFSESVRDYANRSRDHVLRLALISAVSRKHNYIEAVDVKWGIAVMEWIGKRLEAVVVPKNLEGRCADAILAALPATRKSVMAALHTTYGRRTVLEAERALLEAGRVKLEGERLT